MGLAKRAKPLEGKGECFCEIGTADRAVSRFYYPAAAGQTFRLSDPKKLSEPPGENSKSWQTVAGWGRGGVPSVAVHNHDDAARVQVPPIVPATVFNSA